MDVVVPGHSSDLDPLLVDRVAFLDADDAGPYLALELAGAGGVGHDDGVGTLYSFDGRRIHMVVVLMGDEHQVGCVTARDAVRVDVDDGVAALDAEAALDEALELDAADGRALGHEWPSLRGMGYTARRPFR